MRLGIWDMAALQYESFFVGQDFLCLGLVKKRKIGNYPSCLYPAPSDFAAIVPPTGCPPDLAPAVPAFLPAGCAGARMRGHHNNILPFTFAAIVPPTGT